MRGSVTKWHSVTFPSPPKNFSRSAFVTLVDKPVTYKLFPGFAASGDRLLDLDRLRLDLDNDLDLWPLRGETELCGEAALPSLEYDDIYLCTKDEIPNIRK